jgi:hypothetical protein
MARRPAAFRQADLTRALRAAAAAKLDIATIEIEPGGKIVMTTARPAANVNDKPADKWLQSRARAS